MRAKNERICHIILALMADTREQERQRLSELYAQMSEGELREIADDAVDLTDIARQVLMGEIGKRGLDIGLAKSEPDCSLESRDMVTVRQFRYLPEALLAKGILDSAGIEGVLIDGNMMNLLGGIRLQVNRDDVEEAVTLLSEPILEGFDIEWTWKIRTASMPTLSSWSSNCKQPRYRNCC
jgi:hypothetical protein